MKNKINLSLGSSFPTKNPFRAMELGKNAEDPVLGPIALDEVQLCPQNGPMQLTDEILDQLLVQFPNTKFRLHANARLLEKPCLFDLGSLDKYPEYRKALVRTLRTLKTPCSLHAGNSKSSPALPVQFDRLRVLEDEAGVPVAIEGLYPGAATCNTWSDYETVLNSGVRFALDLSHLNIVRTAYGPAPEGLVEVLLESPNCLEVHLSGNDGRRDSHETVGAGVWWFPLLEKINPLATVFYEGRQRHIEEVAV